MTRNRRRAHQNRAAADVPLSRVDIARQHPAVVRMIGATLLSMTSLKSMPPTTRPMHVTIVMPAMSSVPLHAYAMTATTPAVARIIRDRVSLECAIRWTIRAHPLRVAEERHHQPLASDVSHHLAVMTLGAAREILQWRSARAGHHTQCVTMNGAEAPSHAHRTDHGVRAEMSTQAMIMAVRRLRRPRDVALTWSRVTTTLVIDAARAMMTATNVGRAATGAQAETHN